MACPTRCTSVIIVTVLLSLASSAPAEAQATAELNWRTSFMSGVSFGDGETALALSAALDYAFRPRLGLAFELVYARKLDFTLDLCPAPLVCIRGGQFPVTGRTVSLVPQLVFELLPSSGRVRAYVQAGAGVGHVRQRYFVDQVGPESTRSNVVAAFAFGGGVALRLTRRLDIGGDVRSLHLLDEDPIPARFITPAGWLSTLRVGSRVSFRF
jgi:hypothetical protein